LAAILNRPLVERLVPAALNPLNTYVYYLFPGLNCEYSFYQTAKAFYAVIFGGVKDLFSLNCLIMRLKERQIINPSHASMLRDEIGYEEFQRRGEVGLKRGVRRAERQRCSL
jgi:hypothetical protein